MKSYYDGSTHIETILRNIHKLPYSLNYNIQIFICNLLNLKQFADLILSYLLQNYISYIDSYTMNQINYFTIPLILYQIVYNCFIFDSYSVIVK